MTNSPPSATGLTVAELKLVRPGLFRKDAVVERIPVSSVRLPRPAWAPPLLDTRDGVLALPCLDRAVSDAVAAIEQWLTKENNKVQPDQPRWAGAERALAQAMLDSDRERRAQLLLAELMARGLVRAHTAILLPHDPCGSFQDRYGLGIQLPLEIERLRHSYNQRPAAEFLLNWFYQLTGHSDLVVGVMHIPGNKVPEQLGCTHAYVADLVAA